MVAITKTAITTTTKTNDGPPDLTRVDLAVVGTYRHNVHLNCWRLPPLRVRFGWKADARD